MDKASYRVACPQLKIAAQKQFMVIGTRALLKLFEIGVERMISIFGYLTVVNRDLTSKWWVNERL